MKKITSSILLIALICPIILMAETTNSSMKKERNYVRHGNEQYNDHHYRDAEILYKKALEINPTSEIALFNLASSLMKQSGSAQADSPNNPIIQADSIFKSLANNAQNKKVVESSYYNLGNIAFDKQDYSQSIEMYKNTLRLNPDNNDARENLRLAQLKMKEQEQNKDKNKDKNKNNDQQDNKQDQNKNQSKENQEQDKQNQQNNNNDKEESNQSQQQRQQQNQERQQSQGISDANAEKILKTMENEENATRRKVNELKKKEDEKNASRRRITNQW